MTLAEEMVVPYRPAKFVVEVQLVFALVLNFVMKSDLASAVAGPAADQLVHQAAERQTVAGPASSAPERLDLEVVVGRKAARVAAVA